jgi:IclR family acetate operon transcriptional repressor
MVPMPRTGRPATRHVGGVERAFTVLHALAEADGDLGTNELARRSGLHASSVSRLLGTLARSGAVVHVEATGRYRLGPALIRLGHAAASRLDLRELARPHLERLVAETGETATLAVPGEREAVTIDFVRSPSSVQSVAEVGRPSVAYATATGKVMLAYGPARVPAGRLRAYTPRTIASRSALAEELGEVRRRGYATALGERELDLNAVAVPVHDARDALVAILGVQGPQSRFDGAALRRAVAVLREAAAALSGSLGSLQPLDVRQ